MDLWAFIMSAWLSKFLSCRRTHSVHARVVDKGGSSGGCSVAEVRKEGKEGNELLRGEGRTATHAMTVESLMTAQYYYPPMACHLLTA